MKRRILTTAAAVVALLAFVAWRADRRTPGQAADVAADVPLARGVVRRDVRFPCGETTCAGWLYEAAEPRRAPAVVMGHGFAGTRDVGLSAAAERFAGDGIAALVFDYRHFGASGGLPRQLVDPWEQLDDWRAALDWLAVQPQIDAQRMATWGSSLGGGHALIIAAERPQLRAVVAQAPLIDSRAEGEATFYGAAWAARLVLTGWADLAYSAVGGDPILIRAIAPAGGFGMIVDAGAYTAFETLVAPGSTYHNAVAARSAFTFDSYNPARQASAVSIPVLLIASRRDRFVPFAAVEAFAIGRANVTIAPFDGDHFDVYSPPAAEQAVETAARFLAAHLAADVATD